MLASRVLVVSDGERAKDRPVGGPCPRTCVLRREERDGDAYDEPEDPARCPRSEHGVDGSERVTARQSKLANLLQRAAIEGVLRRAGQPRNHVGGRSSRSPCRDELRHSRPCVCLDRVVHGWALERTEDDRHLTEWRLDEPARQLANGSSRDFLELLRQLPADGGRPSRQLLGEEGERRREPAWRLERDDRALPQAERPRKLPELAGASR